MVFDLFWCETAYRCNHLGLKLSKVLYTLEPGSGMGYVFFSKMRYNFYVVIQGWVVQNMIKLTQG